MYRYGPSPEGLEVIFTVYLSQLNFGTLTIRNLNHLNTYSRTRTYEFWYETLIISTIS